MAQISLAWMLSKPGVTAPIIGTTSLKNLEDIIGAHSQFDAFPLSGFHTYMRVIGAVEVKLTDDEVKYLEEPYKPLRNIGHL